MEQPKVYLAGSIAGLNYAGAVDWRRVASRRLALEAITAYSPMRAKEFLQDRSVLGGADDSHPLTSGKGIVARDRFDVMTCDLLLVNLLGAERISIGTLCEIAWADMLRKPVVLVMEEAGNLHDHLFVREIAAFILPSFDAALDTCIAILKP